MKTSAPSATKRPAAARPPTATVQHKPLNPALLAVFRRRIRQAAGHPGEPFH